MIAQCAYVYCRHLLADPSAPCPRCGHPPDPADLRNPAFFLGAMASLQGLPPAMLDMHQILPAYPGIERYQLLAMDQLNIRTALLQSAPDEATSLQGNAALAEVARTHPGRFWASQFVDPRHPEALAQLQAAADRGHRVIKLLPVTGWRADDPSLVPFWAAMSELRLAAMVHTGFFTARHKEEEAAAGAYMSSTHADPLFFDKPCREFPDLRVILCHAGGAIGFEAAAQMISQHEHVWADLSGTGIFALQRLLAGVAVNWNKLFWGNDSPPYAYPLNLRLLLGALDRAGASTLAPALLHDNGARFAEDALA
ncbi:MAG: hypothetical protein EP330_06520 [Deltaproteobacteria bacterium]|nr:MAG: hypothetical protein EP330_06520 [Deltaproteobacteria bacterium]